MQVLFYCFFFWVTTRRREKQRAGTSSGAVNIFLNQQSVGQLAMFTCTHELCGWTIQVIMDRVCKVFGQLNYYRKRRFVVVFAAFPLLLELRKT